MAEVKQKKVTKEKPARVEKKAGKVHAITIDDLKTAKKDDLVKYLEDHKLSAEGKVEELREKAMKYLKEHPPKAAKRQKGKTPAVKKEGVEEEAIEIEEEGAYVPKKKPANLESTRAALSIRRRFTAARPTFLRQEWFRYKALGLKWRRPQGGQSKLRRHFKYRINVVSIGYRGPVKTRGMHPSGFMEVLIHNEKELEGVDPATHAVRIAHGVGTRKRKQIQDVADGKGLRVLNRSDAGES